MTWNDSKKRNCWPNGVQNGIKIGLGGTPEEVPNTRLQKEPFTPRNNRAQGPILDAQNHQVGVFFYAPRIPPTHLNTATFQNLQTLVIFSDFVLWLIAGCWALLVAPNCNVCEVILSIRKMKPNKHQKPSKLKPKWPQHDTKMTPKLDQMGSKIVPLRVWAHFWRPWLASPLFLTCVDVILGSILKVF